MRKSLWLGLVSLCPALAGCGVLTSWDESDARANQEARDQQAVETRAVAEPVEPVAPDRDFEVTIDSAMTTTDWGGDPVIVVTYTFLNLDGRDRSFGWSVSDKAFQNGIELDSAYLVDGLDSGASTRDVKPGVSITVQQAFELQDMSPVTVEVKEWISWDDEILATIIFTLE